MKMRYGLLLMCSCMHAWVCIICFCQHEHSKHVSMCQSCSHPACEHVSELQPDPSALSSHRSSSAAVLPSRISSVLVVLEDVRVNWGLLRRRRVCRSTSMHACRQVSPLSGGQVVWKHQACMEACVHVHVSSCQHACMRVHSCHHQEGTVVS